MIGRTEREEARAPVGWLLLVALPLLVLSLLPLARPPRADGFPFSTYPMFATHRPPLQTISHLLLLDGRGGRQVATPALVGSGEVMQAAAMIRRAVEAGTDGAAGLCAEVAARVARKQAARAAGAAVAVVEVVEVRSEVFDSLAYFRGDRAPRGSTLHARCSVPTAAVPR